MKAKITKKSLLAFSLIFTLVLTSFGIPVVHAASETDSQVISSRDEMGEFRTWDSIPKESITFVEPMSHEEAVALSLSLSQPDSILRDEPGVFTPFDSTPQGSITIVEEPSIILNSDANTIEERSTWTIDWIVPGGGTQFGTNRFNLLAGMIIYYDLRWSPTTANGTHFGVYNVNTGQYTLTPVTSNPASSIFIIPADGLYTFVIGNDSSQTIYTDGSYTVP